MDYDFTQDANDDDGEEENSRNEDYSDPRFNATQFEDEDDAVEGEEEGDDDLPQSPSFLTSSQDSLNENEMDIVQMNNISSQVHEEKLQKGTGDSLEIQHERIDTEKGGGEIGKDDGIEEEDEEKFEDNDSDDDEQQEEINLQISQTCLEISQLQTDMLQDREQHLNDNESHLAVEQEQQKDEVLPNQLKDVDEQKSNEIQTNASQTPMKEGNYEISLLSHQEPSIDARFIQIPSFEVDHSDKIGGSEEEAPLIQELENEENDDEDENEVIDLQISQTAPEVLHSDVLLQLDKKEDQDEEYEPKMNKEVPIIRELENAENRGNEEHEDDENDHEDYDNAEEIDLRISQTGPEISQHDALVQRDRSESVRKDLEVFEPKVDKAGVAIADVAIDNLTSGQTEHNVQLASMNAHEDSEMNVVRDTNEELLERNEENEDEINLHISQTPADVIDVHISQNEKIEERNSMQEAEAEEEEDEINLHITQTQLPISLDAANRMTNNRQLLDLNATYISPMKSENLKLSKEGTELMKNPTPQSKVEEVEMDEEEINLCITPSQKQDSFAPNHLESELTPIIRVSTTKTIDPREKVMNTNLIDPFQLMINPAKDEASNLSIYDFLQGTPNHLSGLSIIKNRGDASMYSSSNIRGGRESNDGDTATIDNDATQLDNISSSQTFLNRGIPTPASQVIEKGELPVIDLQDDDNNDDDEINFKQDNVTKKMERRKSVELITVESEPHPETSRKNSLAESQEWLQANERIPSRLKDSVTKGTTKTSSSPLPENDLERLRELYEMKLKEAEELRKALDLASTKIKNIGKEENMQLSQLGTEEYAKILSSLANINSTSNAVTTNQANPEPIGKSISKENEKEKQKEKEKEKEKVTKSGWEEDSGPLIALPQRKFNTFAKIASPIGMVKTVTEIEEVLSSTEKSTKKIRRKFAGGTPLHNNVAMETSPEKRKIQFDFDIPDPEPEPEPEPSHDESQSEENVKRNTTAKEGKSISSRVSAISSDTNPTETSSTTISQKLSNKTAPAVSSNAKSSEEISKKTEKKKIASEIPANSSSLVVDENSENDDYLPASFKKGDIPHYWAEVWIVLESIGWYWTKGKGLVDFYYIRPNAKAVPPFKLNQDYFATTDDVLEYINKRCPNYSKRSANKTSTNNTSSSESRLRKSKKTEEMKKPILSEEDEEFSVTLAKLSKNHQGEKDAIRRQSSASSTSRKGTSDADESSADDEEKRDEESEEGSDQDDDEEEEGEEEEQYDLRTIPWKDLWKILRSYGWTWDFGPNVLQYYYIPNYDYKKDKEAILGIHKFTTEEEVRRYLKREFRNRLQQKTEKQPADQDEYESMWSLFYLSNNNNSASTQDSQYLNDYLIDEDWTLAKNRKKRHRDEEHVVAVDKAIQKKKQRAEGKEKKIQKKESKDVNNPQKAPSTPELDGEEVNTQIPTLSPERFKGDRSKGYKPVLPAKDMKFPNDSSAEKNIKNTSAKDKAVTVSNNLSNSHKLGKFGSKLSSIPQEHVQQSRKSISPTLTATATAKTSTSHSASTQSTSSTLFKNIKFLFSGISEALREKLEILVKRAGGSILNDIPKDKNCYEENYHAIARRNSASSDSPYFRSSKKQAKDDSENDDEEDNDLKKREIPRVSELIVLISQAKDFRKPKFITAFILGIPILQINYIFDCLATSSLQPLQSYYLPITYSAIHSYHLFPKHHLYEYAAPSSASSSTHAKGGKSPIIPSAELPYVYRQYPQQSLNKSGGYEGIFYNYRLLNLTGMKIWDDILLRCRSRILPRNDKVLYKQLLSITATSITSSLNKAISHHNHDTEALAAAVFPVDIIIFDPISYTKSVIYHNQQKKIGQLPSNEQMNKQNLLTDLEIRILQNCHQVMQEIAAISASVPSSSSLGRFGKTQQVMKVVSIDWITHCVALNEVVNHHCLDLFLLPSDPIHYPMALKFEPDSTTTNPSSSGNSSNPPTNSGERYSKYDLVYFTTSSASAAGSLNGIGNNSSNAAGGSVAIGKILSFSRRNETSVPFVKIQMLETQLNDTSLPPPLPEQGNNNGIHSKKRKHAAIEEQNLPTIKLITPKKFIAEMIVSLSQLVGKVIVLHRKDYYKVNLRDHSSRSSATASIASVETKKLLLLSARDEKKGSNNTNSNSISSSGSKKKKGDDEETINALIVEEENYCTTLAYEHQYSVIPYQFQNVNNEEEEGSDQEVDDDEEEEGGGGKHGSKRKRFVLSQDI